MEMTATMIHGIRFDVVCDNFSPRGHPISNNPAINKKEPIHRFLIFMCENTQGVSRHLSLGTRTFSFIHDCPNHFIHDIKRLLVQQLMIPLGIGF